MNKQHLLNLAILVGFTAFGTEAVGQTSINAGSNRVMIQGNIFDYSIGEMTLISTERTPNLIVTQGYLQPSSQQATLTSHVSADEAQSIRVFPNPTQHILNIESIEKNSGNVNFDLFDASGKVVLHQVKNMTEGLNKHVIDFSSYASGSYFLLVTKSNQTTYSFKIQKTN